MLVISKDLISSCKPACHRVIIQNDAQVYDPDAAKTLKLCITTLKEAIYIVTSSFSYDIQYVHVECIKKEKKHENEYFFFFFGFKKKKINSLILNVYFRLKVASFAKIFIH